MAQNRRSSRVAVAGVLIGIGLGGLIEGIVFQQILQWHNFVSNRIPPTTTWLFLRSAVS